MNQEPVKFLPHVNMRQPDKPDSLYQQNWDLKVDLDRSRDLSKALFWIAALGWFMAILAIIQIISRS